MNAWKNQNRAREPKNQRTRQQKNRTSRLGLEDRTEPPPTREPANSGAPRESTAIHFPPRRQFLEKARAGLVTRQVDTSTKRLRSQKSARAGLDASPKRLSRKIPDRLHPKAGGARKRQRPQACSSAGGTRRTPHDTRPQIPVSMRAHTS